MRAPEEHDRVVVDEAARFDRIMEPLLEASRASITEAVFGPNPLMEWIQAPARLEQMRRQREDRLLRFHHPWRWRVRHARRSLVRFRLRSEQRWDGVRERVAKAVYPYVCPDGED